MEDHNTSIPPNDYIPPNDALPYAPLPEPTKPVAELTLDEIALEDLAYIRIRQTKETRTEIEAHEVVALYHENALDLEVDMPMVPSAGVGLGVGKFGPWDIYMHVKCAEAFADAYPALEVCGSKVMIQSIKAMEKDRPPQAAGPMGISIRRIWWKRADTGISSMSLAPASNWYIKKTSSPCCEKKASTFIEALASKSK
jgi:hypothetical protein